MSSLLVPLVFSTLLGLLANRLIAIKFDRHFETLVSSKSLASPPSTLSFQQGRIAVFIFAVETMPPGIFRRLGRFT